MMAKQSFKYSLKTKLIQNTLRRHAPTPFPSPAQDYRTNRNLLESNNFPDIVDQVTI